MDELYYKPILDSVTLNVKGFQISISDEVLHEPEKWCKSFDQACRHIKTLNARFPAQFFVFPLWSRLGDYKDLAKKVESILYRRKVLPSLVQFELSGPLNWAQWLRVTFHFTTPVRKGVRFVLSNFKSMSLQLLKFFKKFISAIKINNIVEQKETIKKIHNRGLKVITGQLNAEEELDLSRACGSDLVEGDYCGGQLTFDEMLRWTDLYRLRLA